MLPKQPPTAYQPRESLIKHAERTARHLNAEHYFIMGNSVESHHANWLLKFVPPDVNVCETGIHSHCLTEGHKTFFSNVVAGNRQSRRQKLDSMKNGKSVMCKLEILDR